MSFEGYYQYLCKNGHLFGADCWNMVGFSADRCPICNERPYWWNLVDITNGSFDDDGTRIDGFIELKVKQEEEFCTCPDCGNKHVLHHRTYHIPEGEGHVNKVS